MAYLFLFSTFAYLRIFGWTSLAYNLCYATPSSSELEEKIKIITGSQEIIYILLHAYWLFLMVRLAYSRVFVKNFDEKIKKHI